VLCGGEIPIEGKAKVLGNAVTPLIERSQIIRGVGMPFQGGRTVVLGGSCVIFGNSLTVLIEVAEEEFAVGIALSSGGPGKRDDFLIVRERVSAKIDLGEPILGHGIAMIGACLEYREIGGRSRGLLASGRGRARMCSDESEEEKECESQNRAEWSIE
jgi:hypothetical protein